MSTLNRNSEFQSNDSSRSENLDHGLEILKNVFELNKFRRVRLLRTKKVLLEFQPDKSIQLISSCIRFILVATYKVL